MFYDFVNRVIDIDRRVMGDLAALHAGRQFFRISSISTRTRLSRRSNWRSAKQMPIDTAF